jgi:GTPase SAR1 family protein
MLVVIIGNVSVGKSTLVNSLTGKKVLKMGIGRTTEKATVFGESNVLEHLLFAHDYYQFNLVSDDGYEYSIIDMPGLNDGEDKDKVFDTMSMQYCEAADVILWVTDLQKAFTTRSECELFEKTYNNIMQRSLINGKGYQFGILVTKCNEEIVDPKMKIIKAESKMTSKSINTPKDTDIPELDSDTEETTSFDTLKKLDKYLDLPNFRGVFKFNAHGRILAKKEKMSVKVLDIVNSANTLQINTEFNLKVFADNLYKTNQYAMLNKILLDIYNCKVFEHNLTATTKVQESMLGDTYNLVDSKKLFKSEPIFKNIKKCYHGKDPLTCEQSYARCSIHGHCKRATCSLIGNRRWCSVENFWLSAIKNVTKLEEYTKTIMHCKHNICIVDCEECKFDYTEQCIHVSAPRTQRDCKICLEYVSVEYSIDCITETSKSEQCFEHTGNILCTSPTACMIHETCSDIMCSLYSFRKLCTCNTETFDPKIVNIDTLVEPECINLIFGILSAKNQQTLDISLNDPKINAKFKDMKFTDAKWNYLCYTIRHSSFVKLFKTYDLSAMDKNNLFRSLHLMNINALACMSEFYKWHAVHTDVDSKWIDVGSIIPWTANSITGPKSNIFNRMLTIDYHPKRVCDLEYIEQINSISDTLGLRKKDIRMLIDLMRDKKYWFENIFTDL